MIRISLRAAAVATTTVATAAATVLSLAGPAGASPGRAARPMPRGQAALTANPLYKTGEFDFPECSELSRRPDDLDTYRVYLDHLLDCLNTSWTEEFRQAGLRFSPPKVRYITKSVPTGCGKYPAGYAAGMYCPKNATMWILLYKSQLSDPSEFNLFTVIAHEYGHYAQDRAGILPEVYRRYRTVSKKRAYDLTRRVELQAECFSGAFIGSVWHSLGREEFDFEEQLDWITGDAAHGKARSIRYWLKRGWYGNGPKACDTFSAPARTTA
ncbi:neutral zinc metallopeptidase [Microbispora sp. NBC_01189]|uniref:neutral zinc metallopeptidase n=1 Tax=Microbispora sp. NBC_01189 TaxID=2903583 RepID=UPI002E11A0E7|nr:neutral zinc metallopeptidase [Microbispora sp. NBC_01189]